MSLEPYRSILIFHFVMQICSVEYCSILIFHFVMQICRSAVLNTVVY